MTIAEPTALAQVVIIPSQQRWMTRAHLSTCLRGCAHAVQVMRGQLYKCAPKAWHNTGGKCHMTDKYSTTCVSAGLSSALLVRCRNVVHQHAQPDFKTCLSSSLWLAQPMPPMMSSCPYLLRSFWALVARTRNMCYYTYYNIHTILHTI